MRDFGFVGREACPTRRNFLRVAGGSCAALAAAAGGVGGMGGCGAALPGEAIRFWNGFTGPDGRTMLRLVDRFNEASEVPAVMQRMGWGTFYSKLFVAGLGDRAPEVFVLQAEQMARFARAGLLRPMGDVLAPGVLPAGDFDPNVLDVVTLGGVPYGVPLDVHPMGTFYNARLLDAAGVREPPETGEAFIDCLERLAASPGSGGRGVVPFVYAWLRLNALTALWQWGGDVFADGGARSDLASPQAVAAMQWCADLIHQRRLAPSPENFDAWIGFRQGRVGVTWHGIFMVADLEKLHDLPWRAGVMPTVGQTPATWGSSHVLCLRRDLKGDRLAAAVALVKFLSDSSLPWARGGQVPARRSLRDTSEFQQMTAQATFARQMPHVRFMPQVPFVQEYLEAFDFAVGRALRGSMPVADALGEATVTIDRAIARYAAAGWRPDAPFEAEPT